MSHAILSPSAASRWLACTPSARLEERFPDKGSGFAEEGSLAHELGEFHLHRLSGGWSLEKSREEYARITAHELYETEMEEYALGYADYVWQKFTEAKKHTPDAVLRIEEKINLTAYVPEGFGTGDAIIIADGTMEIIDLKYGKGVRVSAVDNKQMMLYALGAYDMLGFLYDISTVRMSIYQPRVNNFSEYEMPVADLLAWGETTLKPGAEMAFKGLGEFKGGDHCRFCKAKAKCKAYADVNLSIASYDFLEAALLTNDDIADILTRADQFKNWITSVETHALDAALAGEAIPGYKLVEGRSVRKYGDEVKIAETLTANGFAEDTIYDKKLKGITAMEKTITKKTFDTLLSPYVIKPEGEPTLVPDSDGRPVYNSAKDDFANIHIND